MNKYENAIEQLQKGITTYVDKTVKSIPYDKTFNAIVIGVLGNGLYNIKLNGVEYGGIKGGGDYKVNDVVKVKIPQNNYNNMYIEGVNGGGGGGAKITIDKKISPTSPNPVENRVIFHDLIFRCNNKEEYEQRQNEVLDGQVVLIKNDGVYIKKNNVLESYSSDIEVDDKVSPTSTNPVQNKTIFNDLIFKGTKEEYLANSNKVLNGQLVALKEDDELIRVYNGLDKTEEGYALDARQGKVLNDKIDNIQSDIGLEINNQGLLCVRYYKE